MMLSQPITLSGLKNAAPIYMQKKQPMLMQPEVINAMATSLAFAIERLAALGDHESVQAIRTLGGMSE